MIDDLEKHPQDKARILAEGGVTVMAAGLGAAAAGTVATAAGAKSIFAVSAAASWMGITAAAATPVGWIVGTSVVSAAAAYGIVRAFRNGAMAEGRKAELLTRYRAEARTAEAKENVESVTSDDRTAFVISLRELVEKNLIEPANAFRLIEQIEHGNVPLSTAIRLIEALLLEEPAGAGNAGKASQTNDEDPDQRTESSTVNSQLAPPHKILADRVENVSMGLGITSGVVAAGASMAAPTGLSAIAIALGISSTPLIVAAAPVIASVATAVGAISGGTYFYSKWKSGREKKVTEGADRQPNP